MAKPVVTVAGEIGSGGMEVAVEAARLMGADFVDRQVLASSAARLGVAVQTVEEKERPILPRGERVARVLETFLERSAVGDPTLGASGVEILMSRSYTDALTAAHHPVLTDAKYVEILRSVMTELAATGNVVILRRGGQALLHGIPGVLHVNVVAPFQDRLARTMQREKLDKAAAEKHLKDADQNRLAYFRKFFKVNPDSPEWYHLTVNTHLLSVEKAGQLIVRVLSEGIV